MVSVIELQKTNPDTIALISPPLLSIVVPVYNGGNKIDATLKKLDNQVGRLPGVEMLEPSVESKESGKTSTGRTIMENASAGILLDEYLKSNPADVPSGISIDTSDASVESQNSKVEKNLGNGSKRASWYEFIVVNDGSSDDTREAIQKIASANERVKLISYSSNMGKGYAIRQGILHSKGKYVMFMDGDGEIDSEVIAKYLENMNTTDIVIGSKYHKLSVVNVPTSRRLLSKCFQLFVKLVLGLKVTDTQVGLKAGNGDAFRKIFQRVTVKRYAFDAEMLAVAGLLKLRVTELPVKIELEKSFKKKEMAKMALDVIGVAYRMRVAKWYQKTMSKKRPQYRAMFISLD